MKQVFKQLIADFHKQKLPPTKKREIHIPLNSKKIVTLIGARRTGKTSLLYHLAEQLADRKQAIYLNFEDERYTIQQEDLQHIITAYYELCPEQQDIYLFLDEIQEIPGWEKFVRRMYDTITKNIFITGSSAKMLSKEIATSLRGRTITYEVYPLSFSEYLSFKDKTYEHTTQAQANITNQFNTYLGDGGFPETIHQETQVQEKTLSNYASVMLLRDVIERNNLRNPQAISTFFDKAMVSYAKNISIQNIYNDFKSRGIKLSKESLYKYLEYFEEAYVLFNIKTYHKNITKQELQKIYLIDHSLTNIKKYHHSTDEGRRLENSVYIHLKRQEQEIYVHKETYECDFLIKEQDQITQAIQVTHRLHEDNKQREIRGLLEAMSKHALTEGIILTLDQTETIQQQNKTIRVLPAQRWMMQNS